MKIALESNRIFIRDIRESDTDAIYSYRSLNEIARFHYWEPYTKEQTKTFVTQCKDPDLSIRGEWIGLAIIYKKNNELIGDCALKIESESAEIGCNISPIYQQLGLASEVLETLISYCFKIVGITEVYGITDSKNEASIRLMQSVGMSRVIEFEEKLICKGVESIEHKYSIKYIK